MANLRQWRKRKGLTQVDAASVLGVSQPYLSLLEKGMRPLTTALLHRMKTSAADRTALKSEKFRAQLSALGYPGFSHIARPRTKLTADVLLISVLAEPNADSRVLEALPWLIGQCVSHVPLNWLVRQGKLQNLQNRLGFILQSSNVEAPGILSAIHELEEARLLQETTLCWDSMPAATRDWMRINRTPLAEHWNILTRFQAEDIVNAA